MSNISTDTKGPVRPPIKMENPRERADRRSAEIMEHIGNVDLGTDKFHIPEGMVPEGWVYEWKRYSILNKEDPHYQISLRHMGWEYVQAEQVPELVPMGTTGQVFRDGMVLMERPKSINDLAKKRDLKEARDQVRMKENQLSTPPKEGQFERDNKGGTLVKVKKSWEPLKIPD